MPDIQNLNANEFEVNWFELPGWYRNTGTVTTGNSHR